MIAIWQPRPPSANLQFVAKPATTYKIHQHPQPELWRMRPIIVSTEQNLRSLFEAP